MKPTVDQAFWSDADVERCGPGMKLAALWLITNSQTTAIGLCSATEARFSFETGLDASVLHETVDSMPRTFQRFGTTVFIRTYIRRQFGTGERLTKNNFFVTLRSAFSAVRDRKLYAAILSEYPEFGESPKGLSTPSEGLVKPERRVEKSREGKSSFSEGQGRYPTLDEFLMAASEMMPVMEEMEARRWWNQREADGWVDYRGFEIKSWRHAAQAKAITLLEASREKTAKARAKKNGKSAPPSEDTPLRVCPIEIELPKPDDGEEFE